MNRSGNVIPYAVIMVALSAIAIFTACRPSPGYQATSLPASQSSNYTLSTDGTSVVEGLPTPRPSTAHTITLDVRTYDPATNADLPVRAVFELPGGKAHFLGPRFTVQVPAERPTRFTVRAPGYTPIDKVMVTHYQRNAHLSMEIPLTPAPLPKTNAQILAMMREAVEGIGYGFAPLLLNPAARVVIEDDASASAEAAYLAYPTQPADPLDWPTMDCFAFAYAIRRHLLSEFPTAIEDIALALAELPSALGDDYTDLNARHVYAWVTFADGHVATLDLTPLAAEPVNPRHSPVMLANHAAGLDSQFETWRQRVPLRTAQPMLTVKRSGALYYLLAGVSVLSDEYQFTLRAYEVQPTTGDQPLRFVRGALAGLRFKRSDFLQVQAMVRDDGPDVFNFKTHLVIRKGDPDPDLAAVLDDHLYLPWHLVTKLQPPE